MAGRGAGGGAQRGRVRGGRHEPAAGAGASTDPDRCAPPPCGGPLGCAVPAELLRIPLYYGFSTLARLEFQVAPQDNSLKFQAVVE